MHTCCRCHAYPKVRLGGAWGFLNERQYMRRARADVIAASAEREPARKEGYGLIKPAPELSESGRARANSISG